MTVSQPEMATAVADPAADTGKLIEFPRALAAPLPTAMISPPSLEELADSILDAPRILDVPENVESSSPMGDISLDSPVEDQPAHLRSELLPVPVALLPQRAMGAAIDLFLVLLATFAFAWTAMKIGSGLPAGRTALELALGIPFVFWVGYQYLFLVYNGKTPGMQVAQLELCTFQGEATWRKERKLRAWSMVLSAISLGLGFLWALFDEDTLCWHDRITRTYATMQDRS